MIKKLLILSLIMMFGAGLAMADDNDLDLNKDVQTTGRGVYTTPCEPMTEWLNSNEDFYHNHDIYTPTRRDQLGVGMDLVLFESQNPLLEIVTAEYKYDINNGEHQAFGVVRVNAYRAISGLFK